MAEDFKVLPLLTLALPLTSVKEVYSTLGRIHFLKVKGKWYASFTDICAGIGCDFNKALEKFSHKLLYVDFSLPWDEEVDYLDHWLIDEKVLSDFLIKDWFKVLQPYFHDTDEKTDGGQSKESYYARQIKGQRIEVWDVTQAWDLGRNEAQSAQYIFRAKYKGQEKDDLKKAIKFLERALEEMEDTRYEL